MLSMVASVITYEFISAYYNENNNYTQQNNHSQSMKKQAMSSTKIIKNKWEH